MKKLIFILVSIAASAVFASVSISVSTKTVQKTGGGGTITVTGTGAWTAVSDSGWISVKSGASGDGDGKVMFTVGENTTADTRIGHINVNDNVYTITQYGYTGTISPTSVTVDRNGKTGTISVTVDAGVEWSATPNVDWITVTPTSGRNVGQVTYTVATYPGVVSRSGSIAIAGQTFTVTQTGVDVNLEPAVLKVKPEADIVQIDITALAATKWTVTPNADWVSVLDKEQGYGDYVLSLVVNANPSFAKRTTTVAVGTATLTIIQEGKPTADLAIDPEFAEAPGIGAYGNVAVYATPDAPWTAESLTPWLTISQGKEGAGNGNIKYVVSPNPMVEEREGLIKITPPYKEPEVDLSAGLVCEIPVCGSAEGNGVRYFGSRCFRIGNGGKMTVTVEGPGTLKFQHRGSYDGYYVCVDNGGAQFLRDEEWAGSSFAFFEQGPHVLSFETYSDAWRWGEMKYFDWSGQGNVELCGTFEINDGSIVFDGSTSSVLNGAPFAAKDDNAFTLGISFSLNALNRVNRLMMLSGMSLYLNDNNAIVFDGEVSDFTVTSTDEYYSLAICQKRDGSILVYAGLSGRALTHVLMLSRACLLNFSGEVATTFLRLGYAENPTPGYLTGGAMKNFRFWSRALSDLECQRMDMSKDTMVDAAPAYLPSETNWHYLPLDGNGYSTHSGNNSPGLVGNEMIDMRDCRNRFGLVARAVEGGDTSSVNFSDMRSLFKPDEPNATFSFWVYINDLPSSGSVSLFKRYWRGKDWYASYDCNVEVSVLPDGSVLLNDNGSLTSYAACPIREKCWHMLTLVGLSGRSLQLFVDDVEIGNVASGVSLGYGNWSNYGTDLNYMHGSFGGGACAIDDLVIYHQALTSAEVRELYNASKAKVVYHTVKQGIQKATLSKTTDVVAAAGENSSVQLTVAQGVNWEAIPNCDWLHVTSDTEGAGSSLVTYTVDANPYVTARTGTMTIAGVTLTIEQIGLEAEVECEKTFFDSVESDMGFINVYTEANGIWTAVSNDDWIQIDPDTEEGNGAGPCWFYIDDYPLTTQSRTGSITIAGKTVYITQSGYKLSIEPAVAEVGSNAGAGQIGVAASIDQVWDVLTDCDWIQIVSGRNGIGNGTVQYQFTDNTTGETRTGTIIIGGQKYTLTQRTTLPVNAQIVGNGSVTGTGNYNQGSKATLRAIPASGQVFSHWSGDAVGNDDSVEITVDIEKNVTATFIPEAAAQKLAEQKAAQGGFYTRDQIHALEMGNLVFDVDASGTARVGVQLMETSDLSDPNSWKPATLNGNPDVGQDGTVGMKVRAEGNAKFFKVVMPEQK